MQLLGDDTVLEVNRDIRDAKALIARQATLAAKFESIFNQSGIFAGILDLEGYMREVNDLAVDWCGYTREQVLDRPFWETPWWRGSDEMKARIRFLTAVNVLWILRCIPFATNRARCGSCIQRESILPSASSSSTRCAKVNSDCVGLRLSWSNVIISKNLDGPPVKTPTHQGFGGRVIKGMIEQLKGQTRFDWRPEGLVCEIILQA